MLEVVSAPTHGDGDQTLRMEGKAFDKKGVDPVVLKSGCVGRKRDGKARKAVDLWPKVLCAVKGEGKI